MSSETADFKERLEKLHDMKSKYRDLKRAAEEAKAAYDAAEREVYADMQDAGVLSIKSTNGHIYSARSTAYAQVQDRERFHTWCEQQGLTDDLLRVREENARINDLVRTALDEGGELPPGLGWYTREFISIA